MRIEKNYIDYGFGFPILIDEVQVDEWCGEEFPLIDNEFLEYFALRTLAFLPARLTGNQVRFIRHHFFETLEEFAQKAGVRHTAVMKWEKAGEKPTNMVWGTEFLLRCRALAELGVDSEELGELAAAFPKPPEGAMPSLRVSQAYFEVHESEPLSDITLADDRFMDEPCCYAEAHGYGEFEIEEIPNAFADAA